MSSLVGYMNIASNAGDTFTNARDNDMLIYTQANTQNILLGAAAGGIANLTISSNLAQFNGNIAINNALAIRGLQIMTNDGSSMNVTQTSVTGFSNDNAGVVLSIDSTANSFRFMAGATQIASLTGTGNLQVTGSITGNISAANITTGTLPVARGGTGTTTSTGTGGSVVLSADPTFTGTVTAATINATTLQQGGTGVALTGHVHDASAITTGTLPITRGGTGTTTNTGTGSVVLSDSATLTGNVIMSKIYYGYWNGQASRAVSGGTFPNTTLSLTTNTTPSPATNLSSTNIESLNGGHAFVVPVTGLWQFNMGVYTTIQCPIIPYLYGSGSGLPSFNISPNIWTPVTIVLNLNANDKVLFSMYLNTGSYTIHCNGFGATLLQQTA